MPKLIWDVPLERTYHVGVDRGVFYIGEVGLPWTGLISVTESPSGGSAQPFYMDGQRVLNIPPGEDFGGAIECYSTPEEFAPCAGRLPIGLGLYAADQPRSAFGFSYRTTIGNALVGAQFGYKVHVIYNAVTWATDFTHETTADTTSQNTHSWPFLTTPSRSRGRRPTAHVIFDTRYMDVSDAEDILYGTESTLPRLPTIEELITLLGLS